MADRTKELEPPNDRWNPYAAPLAPTTCEQIATDGPAKKWTAFYLCGWLAMLGGFAGIFLVGIAGSNGAMRDRPLFIALGMLNSAGMVGGVVMIVSAWIIAWWRRAWPR